MEEHREELQQPVQDDWEDMDLGPLEEEVAALPEAEAALESAVNSEQRGEFPQGEFTSPEDVKWKGPPRGLPRGAVLAMARSQMEREQASRKQAADMDEFARSYRDVDPATISPEVWAAVRRGESLTAAYIRSENRALRRAQTQLQERLAFLEQQARSSRAGTGSQQSAGVKKRDPIDEYWYSDD